MEQFNLIKSKANKIATLKDGDIFETTNYSGEKKVMAIYQGELYELSQSYSTLESVLFDVNKPFEIYKSSKEEDN